MLRQSLGSERWLECTEAPARGVPYKFTEKVWPFLLFTGAASGDTYFTGWHRVVLVPCHHEALPPSQHLGTAQSVRRCEERKDVIEDHRSGSVKLFKLTPILST